MFYGFDWQNTPQFSRLFSPSVVSRGQSAFNQGMQMFRPFDPSQLERSRQARMNRQPVAAPVQSGLSGGFVGPDGRIYYPDQQAQDLNFSVLSQYMANNRGQGNVRSNDANRFSTLGVLLNRDKDLTKIGFRKL